MKKQGLFPRQAAALVALFLLGNCLIFGVNTTSGRDTWIAVLIALGVSIPVLCLYARLLTLHPHQSFFEMVEALLGRGLGAAVTGLLVAFAVHSAAFLIRSVGAFVFVNILPEPPHMLFLGLFVAVAVVLLRGGAETAGKWAVIGISVAALLVAVSVISSLREMDFQAFLPVLRRPMGDVARSSAQIAAFPMLQSVLLLPFLARQGEGFKPRRALLCGLLAAAAILLCVFAHALTMLGERALMDTVFPSYAALKLVRISSFLSRLEKVLSGYILLAALTHLVVCLNAAARGLERLLRVSGTNGLIGPVAASALALSWFTAGNVADMTRFQAVFPYTAALFELVIPLTLWLCAEARRHKGRQAAAAAGAGE